MTVGVALRTLQAAVNGNQLGQQTWSADLSEKSYLGFFDASSQSTALEGVFVKPDGLSMYTLSGNGDAVYQYTFGTAWDRTTLSYASKSLDVSGQAVTPSSMHFSPDGLNLFVGDDSSQTIYRYSLSVAWDVDTATYSGDNFDTGIDNLGIFFDPTGTKLFVTDKGPDEVRSYTLSSAWDLSTVSYDGSASDLDISPELLQVEDLYINPEGSKLYVVGVGNDRVYEYDLPNAWSLDGASYSGSSASMNQNAPTGLYFKEDGTLLLVPDIANDRVYFYSTAAP